MVKEMIPLEAIEVADMESSGATELFRRCAKIQGLGLGVETETGQIVKELGYLALAITLAGSYVVHILKEKRTKVEERSWQGILVGYKGTKNYRIYNPVTSKVTVTSQVTIDEKSFYDKAENTHDLPLIDEE